MVVSGELTVCKAPAKLKFTWYSKTFFKVGRSELWTVGVIYSDVGYLSSVHT